MSFNSTTNILTALVTGLNSNAPTGSITFHSESADLGTVALSGNQAQIPVDAFVLGLHTFTATYNGDTLYASADSAPVRAAVATPPISTTTTLTSSVLAPITDQTFLLSVLVTGGGQGTVSFFDGATLLGSASVSQGAATLSVSLATAGAHTLHADFSPDSHSLPSSSSLTLDALNPVVIDILGLYTPAALIAAGSRDALLSHLQQEIANTNLALSNSQDAVTLRLVGLVIENYQESGNLQTDLARLKSSHDGFMDDVGNLRKGCGADLVVLVDANAPSNGTASTEGAATLLANPRRGMRDQSAYIVIAQSAPPEDFTLAREFGQTLSAGGVTGDPDGPGATAYAHGFRFTGSDKHAYRDIMADGPGTLIPSYSNPSLMFQGVPTGDAATADAARIIREDASIVAAYRTAKPVAAIQSVTLTTISGFTLDPRFGGPVTIRIDIDNHTRTTFPAEGAGSLPAPFNSGSHSFQYTLPELPRGAHVVNIFMFDTATGATKLIGSRAINAPDPLFDENYYLANNPDVIQLIAQKKFKSGWDHFQRVGQF